MTKRVKKYDYWEFERVEHKERHCKHCGCKLAQRNPNDYCFVDVIPYASKEIDEQQDKWMERQRIITKKHYWKNKEEKCIEA